MDIFYLIILGLTLSIDAFSIMLGMGYKVQLQHQSYILVLSIGLFHFIMPILGAFLGYNIKRLIIIPPNIFMSIILFLIAINILLTINKEETNYKSSIISIIVISLSVSLDSFSIGLGLIINNYNVVFSSIIFSIISALITFLGIQLSNYLNNKYQKKFKLFSVYLLLILGIIHILK